MQGELDPASEAARLHASARRHARSATTRGGALHDVTEVRGTAAPQPWPRPLVMAAGRACTVCPTVPPLLALRLSPCAWADHTRSPCSPHLVRACVRLAAVSRSGEAPDRPQAGPACAAAVQTQCVARAARHPTTPSATAAATAAATATAVAGVAVSARAAAAASGVRCSQVCCRAAQT
jgi:hypothetical protein